MGSPYLLPATCTHPCAYSDLTRTQAARSCPPACLVTKRFLSHFAPSFCNILQQIKHPLLGMFSICFMLILIKESETEQTVPSRWPYKCEISKLFYLPQTLLVNFFKLIPASESLPIPRRRLSNPSLQIFAFVTAPGANDWWCPPLLHAHPPCLPDPSLWHSFGPTHSPRARLMGPHHLGSTARVGRCSGESSQPCGFQVPPPPSHSLPLPVLPPELGPSHLSPGKNRPGGPGQALRSSPWYSPAIKGTWQNDTPGPSKGVNKQASPPALTEAYLSTAFLENSLCIRKALEFFLLWDPKIPQNNH